MQQKTARPFAAIPRNEGRKIGELTHMKDWEKGTVPKQMPIPIPATAEAALEILTFRSSQKKSFPNTSTKNGS